jgi:hypothetical protein
LPFDYVPAAIDSDADVEPLSTPELTDFDLAPSNSAEIERPNVVTPVQTLAIQFHTGHYQPDDTLLGEAVRAEEKRMIESGVLPKTTSSKRKRKHAPETPEDQAGKPIPASQTSSSSAKPSMQQLHALHAAQAKHKFLTTLPEPNSAEVEPSPMKWAKYGCNKALPSRFKRQTRSMRRNQSGDNSKSSNKTSVKRKDSAQINAAHSTPLSQVDEHSPMSSFVEPDVVDDTLSEPSIFDFIHDNEE